MSVLISGATGFIALHTIDVLLSKNFKVVGTVRSAARGDNIVKNFKEKYPDSQLTYEIVKDISADGAFDEVLKKYAEELEFVLHTASPFSFGSDKNNDDAFLKPAVNGTLNMLKGIKQYAPKVKAVVVTSSFASIYNAGVDTSFIHTEETWNPITWEQARDDESKSYYASKKCAEELAWNFVKTENPNFQLSTICPPYVFGPQEFEDSLKNPNLNTSAEIINGLLKTTPQQDGTAFKDEAFLSVDVRDVAKFHVLPLERPELRGKRLFPAAGKWSGQRMLNIINKNFPELNGKISKGLPEAADEIDKSLPSFDNSVTLKLTGAKLIPLEKSVIDSVDQILKYQKSNK